MFDTTKTPLDDVLSSVASGKLQLPDFQRGWVWDDDRIRGLLASISRGFPVGAIMTLQADGDIRLKPRLLQGVSMNMEGVKPSSYLLDGQQRLTSLYQALRLEGPVETTDSKKKKVHLHYYVDMQQALDAYTDRQVAFRSLPKDKRIMRDFGREIELDLSTPALEYEQHMIPTEKLMNPMDWAFSYANYWTSDDRIHPEGDAFQFVKQFVDQIAAHFSKYQLPVIELTNDTPKEAVCLVFEKVNTGGVRLTVFELATASFAMDEAFNLREDWEKRKKRLAEGNAVLGGLGGDQFLQAIALLKTQDDRRKALEAPAQALRTPAIACNKRDILDLKLDDYKQWADRIEQGFIEAARFLRSQYVFGSKNVPYSTQLVPLAALFVELGSEANSQVARQRIERWYWSGIFGEVYGGQIETQFANDLVDVAKFVRDGTIPRMVNETNFVADRLISLRTRTSAAYKGLYALQMKSQARDWLSGEPLSFGTFDNANIDIHHIFPVAWCRQQKIGPKLYDSIINKTPVDAGTNRRIGGQAPSRYLSRIKTQVTEGNLSGLLESHWVELAHLESDNFNVHFAERGQRLLDLIGRAIGRDLGNGRPVFEKALVDAGVLEMYVDDEPEYDEVGESEQETDAA